ncbi:NADPH--cytochrome P450 reductase [Gryllus bimaculatus]|nr:NADPH--cytochrome P450 reductase [Gryllus bimaculatus]
MEFTYDRVKYRELLRTKSNLGDIQLTLPRVPPSVLDIDIRDEEITPPTDVQNGCSFPLCTSSVFEGQISEANYMTLGDDVKKVISCYIHVKDLDVSFKPGDAIAILPCNLDTEVEKFAVYLKVKDVLNKKCSINIQTSVKKKSNFQHIPTITSLNYVLKYCVDIRSVPKKAMLLILSECASDSFEKRCLQELCSREGSALYNTRILEPGATIQDVLASFPSCQPPLGRILELLPRLLPRPYSIASSPLISPHSVRLVLSVVEQPVKGLCSGWLHDVLAPLLGTCKEPLEKQMEELSLKPKQTVLVPVSFRRTHNFNLPDDLSVPLILIGPGTGIAPFIGFLQHRSAQKKMLHDVSFGEIWLFYGCRYSDRDFLFRSDIYKFMEEGILSRLFISFSRETTHNGVKYVQDNIKKHARIFIQKILEERAMIYVCGDGKNMATDVWKTIVHLISSEKGIPEEEALSLLLKMQEKGTYKQDIWL